MRPRGRVLARFLVVVVAWTTATVLAGVVAWTAVSRLGREGGATLPRPMAQSEVRQRLGRALPTQPVAPHVTMPATPNAARRSQARSFPDTRRTTTSSATQSRSWQILGGTVGAACHGEVIDLLYASPLDGWAYRLDRQAPVSISVEFSRAQETSTLVARCVHGVPSRVASTAQGEGTGSDGDSGD